MAPPHSHAEGRPAAAGGFRIRVLESEPAADEVVRVVELKAVEEHGRLGVNGADEALVLVLDKEVSLVDGVLGDRIHDELMPEQPPERTPMRSTILSPGSSCFSLSESNCFIAAGVMLIMSWSVPTSTSARSTCARAGAVPRGRMGVVKALGSALWCSTLPQLAASRRSAAIVVICRAQR
eukprot:CAMPEP_0185187176 /NCGR_PEP_ID=MMETSP1140-20130426/4557_1 /TAXON_ID=298111 /ORGANISM="Pavlova sp., Strain CCMP459" /LENGTH=179 /DNA_ID=CAMNT_0027753535 /DNA_START=440 /DNA_END=976 /DNA_ORIENTATION=-